MIALDDNIEDHPKFVGLSDDSFSLWVRCLGYCRRLLTDGYVPEAAARARCRGKRNPTAIIAELLAAPKGAPGMAPLWSRVDGGYQVHDYSAGGWNPTRAQVEAQREAKREAGRAGGKRSGEARRQQEPKQATKQEPSNSEAECFESGSPLANPDPIRSDPVPIRISPGTSPPLPPSEGGRAGPGPTAAAQDLGLMSAAAEEIHRALRTSSALKSVATPRFARHLAEFTNADTNVGMWAVADVVAAIGEADAKARAEEAAGSPRGDRQLATMVSGFVKVGPRKAPARTTNQPRRPQDVRAEYSAEQLAQYEREEAEERERYQAEVAAKRAADEAAGIDTSF